MKNELEKIASDPNETREAFILRMEEEGYIPTYPEECELQLDLDNAQHKEVFKRSFEILSRKLVGVSYESNVSRSGNGLHVRIRMPWNLSPFERIAWQAALGSDPVRELLSCFRQSRGDEHSTMLIEAPDWKEHLL